MLVAGIMCLDDVIAALVDPAKSERPNVLGTEGQAPHNFKELPLACRHSSQLTVLMALSATHTSAGPVVSFATGASGHVNGRLDSRDAPSHGLRSHSKAPSTLISWAQKVSFRLALRARTLTASPPCPPRPPGSSSARGRRSVPSPSPPNPPPMARSCLRSGTRALATAICVLGPP